MFPQSYPLSVTSPKPPPLNTDLIYHLSLSPLKRQLVLSLLTLSVRRGAQNPEWIVLKLDAGLLLIFQRSLEISNAELKFLSRSPHLLIWRFTFKGNWYIYTIYPNSSNTDAAIRLNICTISRFFNWDYLKLGKK